MHPILRGILYLMALAGLIWFVVFVLRELNVLR